MKKSTQILKDWDGISDTENTLYEISQCVLREEVEMIGGEYNEWSRNHSERGIPTFHPDRFTIESYREMVKEALNA